MNKSISFSIVGVTMAMVIFQMVSSQVYIFSTIPYLNLHILFCVVITLLHRINDEKTKGMHFYCILLLIISLFSFGYLQLFWEDVQARAYFNTPLDLIIGLTVIFISLEATRLSMGLFIPILSMIVVVYGFLGQYLPEPFTCQTLRLNQTITNLSVGFEGGVYAFLHISANFLFLFVLFGGVLNATGASKLFIMLGRMVMTKIRGGAAMMAVVASAGVGSITGSAAANVAVTGPITIPLMKKTGFTPEEAGGIEAAASNGGQIMPPIMGMVAFAMAGLTGIPYLKIVVMSIIPALIYFFTLGLYVYFAAGKHKIMVLQKETEEAIDKREWAFASLNFLFPIGVIIVLLLLGFSINFVGFWAIISVLAVSLVRKKSRPTLTTFIKGFVQGTRQATAIGVSTACVGLILSTFNMSGLGVKLVLGIEAWSQGYLFLALVLIFIISVIMGMGGASITAYIIVSVFTVPALKKMGLTFEQGHFFAMFVAVFAFLTPPVAMVALIASRVADGAYLKTAIEATKAALGGFLLPFMFAYCPLLLLQPRNTGFEILGFLAVILVMVSLEAAFVGHYVQRCNTMERIGHFVVAILLFLFIMQEAYFIFGIALILIVVLVIVQWLRTKNVLKGPETWLSESI